MTCIPKRLIEVDLPIKRISMHARDEKEMRRGYIPLLHIWPATRPPAACRAVACAAMWPDPADKNCPAAFTSECRNLLSQWAKRNLNRLGADSYERFLPIYNEPAKLDDPLNIRSALLDFIADFSGPANANDSEFIGLSRAVTAAAQKSLFPDSQAQPLVVDPFAGAGIIPLEALRIGADTFASDLNPVAVLLEKVVLEYLPKYGNRLVDVLDQWAASLETVVNEPLRTYYPQNETIGCPTAYIWARTILSEAPDETKVAVEVPLISSMVLANKSSRFRGLRFKREQGRVVTTTEEVTYANGQRITVRRPQLEIVNSPSQVGEGTMRRGSVTCPVTGFTTPVESVRRQLRERNGGAQDARLLLVVVDRPGDVRDFRLATPTDVEGYICAAKRLRSENQNNPHPIGSEPLPLMSGVFNAPIYGHTTWRSLFNERQLLVLERYIAHTNDVESWLPAEEPEFQRAALAAACLVLDKVLDNNSALCTWQKNTPNAAHVFVRWALPMVWDYAEVNPTAGAGGSPKSLTKNAQAALKQLVNTYSAGSVGIADASRHPLPDDSCEAVITDPPYYNAIPYADISDYFYVWLKRMSRLKYLHLFESETSPKEEEIVEMSGWDPVRYSHKGKKFFEQRLGVALAEARRILKPGGVLVVVFAHKSTEGWEALLQATIDAGWVITSSWPIDTEMAFRMRGMNSAALSSSVHLVCRPREKVIETVADWRDVLHELPTRIHDWMPRLATEGVVGADAIFACIGPALEVFSRTARVEKANGDTVTLNEYLEHVWAAVAKEALAMVFKGADASGFEEDARLTAMWLWTMSTGEANGSVSTRTSGDSRFSDEEVASTSGYSLEFDAARKISQGLGAHLESLTSLIEVKGKTARLLPVAERTRKLFGKDDAQAPVLRRKKKAPPQLQLSFVDELQEAEETGAWGKKGVPSLGSTVLDRVHQSMILFAAGRSEALRRFLVDEGVGRDERFWRLAQVLSYLSPKTSDEKRWVDGVLARKKGLGF